MIGDNVFQPPRQLRSSDSRADFTCGVESLDVWFQKYALQNQRPRNCAVYVTTWNDRVVGYYAICTGGLERGQAPERITKGRPAVIPVMIIARLAVDVGAQGKSVGRKLLQDAIERCATAAPAIGAAAIVVHALDAEAKRFYQRCVDFVELPGEPLHLIMPTKGLGRAPL